MTNDEIMMFFREAQEQQAMAFPTKKVSYYLNTNYTFSTNGIHFDVSVFYEKNNKLFNFSVGHLEDSEEVRLNFRIAEAIIEAAACVCNE